MIEWVFSKIFGHPRSHLKPRKTSYPSLPVTRLRRDGERKETGSRKKGVSVRKGRY